jgi:hypothetical protein
MEAIGDLVRQDKTGKRKQVAGEINFWQYFNGMPFNKIYLVHKRYIGDG